MVKRETLFLKMAVVFIGIPILALCVLILTWIIKDAATSSTRMATVLYGILAVMVVSAIPFFMALFQAFKLLNFIDLNNAFSELSVIALKNINHYKAAISGLYVLSMPLFFIVGEIDDAPGVILVGMVFVFAPLVVSVFAAVLQKLLQNAIEIKHDYDLTI